MKHTHSVQRPASARLEALETRSMFSGEIDHAFGTPSFGNAGVAGLSNGQFEIGVYGDNAPFTAVQADGKIVVAGSVYNNRKNAAVYRFNANGTPDTAFGTNGVLTISNVNANRLNGVEITKDGKIFLEGPTYVRLTSTGAFDTTFGGGDGIAPSYLAGDRRDGGVNTNVVLADGSYFELSNTRDGQGRLYKYKADGSVDKSFNNGGSYNLANLPVVNEAYEFSPDYEGPKTGVLSGTGGIAMDAQGRLYISYQVSFPNDAVSRVDLARVVRLTATGKLDTAYGTNGAFAETGGYSGYASTSIGNAIAVTADGRVLLEQNFATDHSNGDDSIIALNPTGQAVGVYGSSDGILWLKKIVPAQDGSVYLVGTTFENKTNFYDGGLYNSYASVVRLTSDLLADPNYSADKDGVAGFRFRNVDDGIRGLDGALTPGGDFVVLGGKASQIGLVKFDGPNKKTRVTYSFDGEKLVVNGSGGNDFMSAANEVNDPYYAPNGLHVRLDDSLLVTSEDSLFYENDENNSPLVKRLVINLNSGNDWFDGSRLTQGVYVTGGNGNDYVIGGSANDTLYGGDGNDTLVGGGGKNTIVQ